MLVATPGQTASYPLHGSGSNAPKKTCHTTTATPKSSSNNNNTSISAHNVARPIAKTPSAVDALVKSLSVRLNRSTDFLMGTMQKAFVSTTNGSTNSNSNATTVSNNNNNNNSGSSINAIKTANSNPSTATTGVTASTAAKSNKQNSIAVRAICSTTATSAAAATKSATAKVASASTSTSTSVLKLYTVPPTIIHRYPEERLQAGSVDSLHKEMCHFKPIRAAPTTPWKCGSRSRGAVLRMPKASLATKVKLNCDVSLAAGNSNSDESDDINEEKDAALTYNQYRPKPSSTLLTTIISTPSHQSAFVCLVAKMKNLVNIKTTKQSSSKSRKSLNLHKTRSIRGRTKAPGYPMTQVQPSPINVPLTKLILRNRQQPYVHVKNLHLPAELIIKRSVRKCVADGAKSATNVKMAASSKGGGDSGGKKASISVSTKRSKLRATKSKIINIVAFAQESNNSSKKGGDNGDDSNVTGSVDAAGDTAVANEAKRQQRKRRHSRIAGEKSKGAGSGDHGAAGDNDNSLQPVRKSARLSKDYSSEVMQIMSAKNVSLGKRQTREVARRKTDCFSPPLTRSRLRQLTQRKLNNTLEQRQRVS